MKGRLEARCNFAGSALATFTDDSANTEDLNLAGDEYYYISSADTEAFDLLDQIEDRINDSSGIDGAGDTITVTMGATGLITIAFSGASGAVSWADTSFRDFLGFTGDLSASNSYTGTNQCEGVWLPDCDFQNLTGENSGWWEFDDQEVESPRGDVYALHGAKKKVNALTWPAISRARAWTEAEVVTNESFETFLLNAMRVGQPWSDATLRFHPDETSASYFTYKAIKGEQMRHEFLRQNWTGKYAVTLPRLVRDPDE